MSNSDNKSTIPNPLDWPTYDKYKKSEMDLLSKEEATPANNYGNLHLPEISYDKIKPLWDYLKDKTGFDYELFHSGNMKFKEYPRNNDGSWGDLFGINMRNNVDATERQNKNNN